MTQLTKQNIKDFYFCHAEKFSGGGLELFQMVRDMAIAHIGTALLSAKQPSPAALKLAELIERDAGYVIGEPQPFAWWKMSNGTAIAYVGENPPAGDIWTPLYRTPVLLKVWPPVGVPINSDGLDNIYTEAFRACEGSPEQGHFAGLLAVREAVRSTSGTIPREPTTEMLMAGGKCPGMEQINAWCGEMQLARGRTPNWDPKDPPLAQAWRAMWDYAFSARPLICETCRYEVTALQVQICTSGEACPHKFGKTCLCLSFPNACPVHSPADTRTKP